jgi:hypothetical protein
LSFAASGNLSLTASAKETDTTAINIAKVVGASRTSNIESVQAGWFKAGFGERVAIIAVVAGVKPIVGELDCEGE